MKKSLLLFTFVVQICFAQQLEVTSFSCIKNTESGGFYYPKFSPNGDFLLTSSENYCGLKQITFTSNAIQTITEDAGAGYGVQISADGNSILYKKTVFEKNLRYNGLMTYSRSTGKHNQLIKPSRAAIISNFETNKPAFIKDRKMIRTAPVATNHLIICVEDKKMVLYNGTIRKEITPNGQSASYIWPSISPDKRKIAYTVATKGTYVSNIDGSHPISIGKLNAPTWLSNQWIIGMNDTDDGEKVISSTIVAASADGKLRQTLTTPANKIAMYPSASADGSRIAFNTIDGQIYLLTIKVK